MSDSGRDEIGWFISRLAEQVAADGRADSPADDRLDLLAKSVVHIWKLIEPHNAMECAESLSGRLPAELRPAFGERLQQQLSEVDHFDRELRDNPAGHCLERAIAGTPNVSDAGDIRLPRSVIEGTDD